MASVMSAVSAGFATRCAVTSTRPRGAARSNRNRAASPVKGLGCGLSFSTRSVGDPRFTGFGSRVRPNAVSDSSNTATDGTDTEYVPPEKSMEEQLMMDSSAIPENFCIIEAGNPGVGKVRDFADLDATDLMTNIESRKNRIFIMLEEDYYIYWAACVVGFLFFGGLIAPLAEVKLGIGGTTYLDFIESMYLPRQLAEVDPIVASFTGGAVGAISIQYGRNIYQGPGNSYEYITKALFYRSCAFFVIEIQNFKEQEKKLCMYCKGTGYLQCAECCTSDRPGRLIDPVSGAKCFCGTCSGTAKVMCSSCLATGREIVTEHDRRIDPFD